MKQKNTATCSYNIQQTNKFTSIVVEVAFTQIQNEKEIEARNLVAKVLPQKVAAFPTKIATKSYFADLYAARVASGVKRNGALHEVTFQFIFSDPKVVNDEAYTLDDILLCIERVLFAPAVEEASFSQQVFQVEKQLMIAKIISMYDDKTAYAQTKLLENMFAGTPFAIRPYGKVENYEQLTNAETYAAYERMLKHDNVSVSVVGDVDAKMLQPKLETLFANVAKETAVFNVALPKNESNRTIQTFSEKHDVNQTKLHMGYRLPVTVTHPEYFKHRVAIEILGGGAQSKLFQNVREKASLAYYVAAMLDPYAQAMYIYSGIEESKLHEAQTIINEQIQAICAGNVSDDEIFMAKTNMLHRLSMLQDSATGMISLTRQLAEFADVHTLVDYKNTIEAITLADIVTAAKTWQEDTVFILSSENKGGDV